MTEAPNVVVDQKQLDELGISINPIEEKNKSKSLGRETGTPGKLQEQLLHTSRMEDICDHLMEAAAELTVRRAGAFPPVRGTSEFEQKSSCGCFP